MDDAAQQAALVQDQPVEFRITLDQFARTLRPQSVQDRVTKRVRLLPGQPDEVWLKFLRINHRHDKRTAADWSSLIDTYRDAPAHPTAVGA